MSDTTINEGGLRLRFTQGIIWNVVGAVFTQGSVFLVNVVVANLLGKDVYGEFGMIQSTLLTLTGIAQVATGMMATKYVAEFRLIDKEKTGRILGLCSMVTFITAGIATLLLLFGAQWLSNSALNAPRLASGLMISSGFVLFSVINGYQAGALAGLEGYRALVRAGVFQGAIHMVICTLGAWCFGLEGVLGSLVASAFFRWCIYRSALGYECRKNSIIVTYNNAWSERKIIYRFALPAAISGLTSMPALWLANAFLVQQKDGFSQMGLYSAANIFRTMVVFLPVLINNVGMSLLNNQQGIGNISNYRKIFWANFGVTVITVLSGALFFTLSGPWLLNMFGKSFAEGFPVLMILMVSTIPESISVATFQIIQSHEMMWLSFFAVSLPRDLLIVILSYFLIPTYGAAGLASSYATSWVLASVIIMIIVARRGITLKSNYNNCRDLTNET